ncbi:acyltransferase family protein [Psychroserpens sp. MEBiC05023]
MVKKKILYDVKIATGIAILLVVVGHLASRGQEGVDLYVSLKEVIYKFHMPLFLFMSGYISGYTYKPINESKDYLKFVKKKVIRLFPAYLLLSILFFLGKYFLGQNQGIFKDLINILIYPSKGNSGFLWYIYVLFLYYLITPCIMSIKNKNIYMYLVFIGSLILSFFNFPDVLSLNFFFWYLPYFILGCFLSNNIVKYTHFLRSLGVFALFLFGLWFVLEYLGILNFHKNIVSFIAIIAIHYLSLKISEKRACAFLKLLGENSFNIYLFNTLFMGGITFFLKKILGYDLFIESFYLLAPFIIFSGVFLPIILYKIIKKRLPLLAKYIH